MSSKKWAPVSSRRPFEFAHSFSARHQSLIDQNRGAGGGRLGGVVNVSRGKLCASWLIGKERNREGYSSARQSQFSRFTTILDQKGRT
jgi:hypothetical protein